MDHLAFTLNKPNSGISAKICFEFFRFFGFFSDINTMQNRNKFNLAYSVTQHWRGDY